MSGKNFGAALGTSLTTVYTCPASTEARVTLIQICNVDGSNAADVTVQLDPASGTTTKLCHQAEVPAQDAITVIAGGLILEAGDTIEAVASAPGDLHLTGSVIERAV